MIGNVGVGCGVKGWRPVLGFVVPYQKNHLKSLLRFPLTETEQKVRRHIEAMREVRGNMCGTFSPLVGYLRTNGGLRNLP